MFKSFVIILKDHSLSEEVGNECIESGLHNGWNIQRFDAVDGRITKITKTLNYYGLKLDTNSKKQVEAINRPGVFGNFITHYKLWNLCVDLDEPIGCFEHDVIFNKSPESISMTFQDLLKLDKLQKQKNYGTGNCYQGAHAYIIKPSGAKKLINRSKKIGIMGADVMIGDAVLNIEFNQDRLIQFNSKTHTSDGLALFSTSKTTTF